MREVRNISRKGWKDWRFFIGRDPRSLPPRSIILLPHRPNTLFCGLAGILAIKGWPRQADDPVERITTLSESLKKAGLEHVVPEAFLGEQTLADMETALYDLKQDIDRQFRLHTDGGLARLLTAADELAGLIKKQEAILEKRAGEFPISSLEIISSRLIALKDIQWGLKQDLLKNQEKILSLSGGEALRAAWIFKKYQRLNFLLNALDRLEVRGRDSTGIQIALAVPEKAMDAIIKALKNQGLSEAFDQRILGSDLMHGSISRFSGGVAFTYKTASITGELGKNCRELRRAIQDDAIFKTVVRHEDAGDMYLAHTRWASVGAINIPNCHPVNNCTLTTSTHAPAGVKDYPAYGKGQWFINVVLNGDIDNYLAIKAQAENQGRLVDQRVTTDTKVIPLAIEDYLLKGHPLTEAFRLAVNDFAGSHAIAMESNLEPGKVFLALHGSGQSLFVGLAKAQFLFASEVYGLVEETPYFIKMDGESRRNEDDPASMGQVFILNNDQGPGLAGIEAVSYDGHPLTLTPSDIKKAEITTRDIDRGDFRHYLLKEIMDAPSSIRKTLRGKYRIAKGACSFNLGEEVFPKRIMEALTAGDIRTIYVIGQGTAAVAGSAIAEALSVYLKGTRINIQAKKASDLSGFVGDEELKAALVIAVTQSGTTTDTNRAVTMAREKGAHIIAIVNRRQSDITTKAHGVFYTSDGRDIEMSVASTKAFYSQIVAGYVLALSMAKALGAIPDATITRELANLEKAPQLMNRVIGNMAEIRQTAWDVVRRKRYWAVVGSGTNKVAADEVRIKLSELCYKTISSDIIEDKKHIDLSAEPLILVMAAGSPEIVLEDIVKDTAIFKAHSAKVVVIADEGEDRFKGIADSVFHVPRSSFPLSVIMNTLAGHIWGYYAACSLDEQAGLFRDFRIRLTDTLSMHEAKGYSPYESIASKDLRAIVDVFAAEFHAWRSGAALATMNVDTASDLTLLLKYAVGKLPVEDFREDFKDKRVSSSPLEMLDITLGKAIDELSRPVDAIRHQAKTVTVGTSRKVEALKGVLFDPMTGLGLSFENLMAKDVLTLKRLQLAVSGIKGYTLYCIRNLDEEGRPNDFSTISTVKKGGIAQGIRSRADEESPLMGTKRTIVRTGEIYAGGGKSDDASIVIIPLLGESHSIENLLLLHVDFQEHLSPANKREVLGEKYADIKNLINEQNLSWSDDFLDKLTIKFLLGEAVEVIVGAIKTGVKD
ncbi:MAG: SIS domain-containing protein [Syntrophaceae bacterium]